MWWSDEPGSRYNTWVVSSSHVSGEHLVDVRIQYEFALSTGYNSPPNKVVEGRGTAIFLHVFDPPDVPQWALGRMHRRLARRHDPRLSDAGPRAQAELRRGHRQAGDGHVDRVVLSAGSTTNPRIRDRLGYTPLRWRLGRAMRARRVSGDDQAIDELGRVNRLYAVLSKVNEAIVRIHEPRDLFEAACKIAVEDGDFILAWIGLVEPSTKLIKWVARYGRDEGYLDKVDISLDESLPQGRGPTGVALREGRPFVNNDTESNPAMRPWREEQLKRGYRSSASFPLRSEGTTIGALTLYAGEPDYFDEEEVRLLTSLADDFSFALEAAEVAQQRAQALEDLRASHDELEQRVKERTAVLEAMFEERSTQASFAESLNRINEAVHSTLDFDQIMKRVVVEITHALCVDATVVQVRKDGYWEFAYEHGIPEEFRHLRLQDSSVPLSMQVLETGLPIIANDVANDARVNAPLMETLRITAVMGVPLVVRGEVLGILLANRFDTPVAFTAQQLDFLQKAAGTLALALENARLYELEHDTAERLQSALLALPEHIPGVKFATAYHSATVASRVGGDLFDIFEIDRRHVGITIGDVAGKGLDAAVLTSLAKHTIRAHAAERGKGPSRILELTNEVVFRSTPPESFVTIFFAILDRRDGQLVYANAGHTTSALMRADGTILGLPTTGAIVGGLQDMAFGQQEVLLEPDDLLFLYTDGLTEARRDGELYGKERLFEFLASLETRVPADIVAEVIDETMSFADFELRDDLAIMVVRRVTR